MTDLPRPDSTTPAGLMQLPNELLLQILPYCHPTSILQLSRTCRSLHTFLTSRTSSHIWEYARLQIPAIHCKRTSMLPFGVSFTTDVEISIPEKPAEMSEIAFAHLLFEDVCTTCGEPATFTYPELSRRACTACSEANLKILADFVQLHPDANKEIIVGLLRSCSQFPTTSAMTYWKPDFDAVFEEYCKDKTLARNDGVLGWHIRNRGRPDRTFGKVWREWIAAEKAIAEETRLAKTRAP